MGDYREENDSIQCRFDSIFSIIQVSKVPGVQTYYKTLNNHES